MTKKSVFETLSAVDVSTYIDKKGQFSYLSWSDAVTALLRAYPEATWEVVSDVNGLPYITAPNGCFVTVAVTVEGITRTQIHPVLDFRNNAIADPNPMQINTSIQRALAKAIGLHGLGLHIYRGEDINPDAEKSVEQVSPEPINQEHVNYAVSQYRELIDLDAEDADKFPKMQAIDRRLTNDERIKVMEVFGKDKHEGGRLYRTLVKDYLSMKKEDSYSSEDFQAPIKDND